MKQYEQLIDRLADKTLSFGCLVQNNWSDVHKPYTYIGKGRFWSFQFKKEFIPTKRRSDEDKDPYKILGHPILIGDVLEEMGKKGCGGTSLCRLWQPLGFTRSLQDIFEMKDTKNINPDKERFMNTTTKQLTPQASELLLFLETIFND